MTHRHVEFQIDPMRIPTVAATYAKTRQMIADYARAFDAENGDTLNEYVDRASFDVYPASLGQKHDRAEFRRGLKAAIRGLAREARA
jgi:hypothetical protein